MWANIPRLDLPHDCDWLDNAGTRNREIIASLLSSCPPDGRLRRVTKLSANWLVTRLHFDSSYGVRRYGMHNDARVNRKAAGCCVRANVHACVRARQIRNALLPSPLGVSAGRSLTLPPASRSVECKTRSFRNRHSVVGRKLQRERDKERERERKREKERGKKRKEKEFRNNCAIARWIKRRLRLHKLTLLNGRKASSIRIARNAKTTCNRRATVKM